MITKDKVIEIFCIIDEFDKNLNAELAKNRFIPELRWFCHVVRAVAV